jgi:galactokinase
MQRWEKLSADFRRRFAASEFHLFSTPGRTELGGNHTDHNHGKVLAAAIDLDSIAVAAKSPDHKITVFSEGYASPFIVPLEDLAPVDGERGSTTALIRGVASRFQRLGRRIGGFSACITSDVLVGSGLSSSASIEVLIATMLNVFYNDAEVDALQIAAIGQYAENVYFGKPCGLMDQIACAVGGIVKIDFHDPQSPHVEKVEYDFADEGLSLVVIDTGGSHHDLTEDYAAIPREMKSVAAHFGKEVCADLSEENLLNNLGTLRGKAGDRALLRAWHFLEENKRVDLEVKALREQNLPSFLQLVQESGNSSIRWLQNGFAARNAEEQGIMLALALAEKFLRNVERGACRVHGGGFAGTVLVFLPQNQIQNFAALMEQAFSPGCVKQLNIRPHGTIHLQ